MTRSGVVGGTDPSLPALPCGLLGGGSRALPGFQLTVADGQNRDFKGGREAADQTEQYLDGRELQQGGALGYDEPEALEGEERHREGTHDLEAGPSREVPGSAWRG